jgi:hypothetical protein
MSHDFLNILRQNNYESIVRYLEQNKQPWTDCDSVLHRSRDYVYRFWIILRTKCKDCSYELSLKYILRGPENTLYPHIDKLNLLKTLIESKNLSLEDFTNEQLNIKIRDHGNYEYNQEVCKLLFTHLPVHRSEIFLNTLKNCDAKEEWKEEILSLIKMKKDV